MDQVRVDPAALCSAADEVMRLAGVVHASRAGATGQVASMGARLGEMAGPVGDQWRAAEGALDRVEADFREIGWALGELATYFADLDRRSVGR